MRKVLVIAGPTASGKTSFSLEMAELLPGEIISGDSIQVYRGLDIGSGKIMPAEMRGIPHHLIDILDPGASFSAADFQHLARREIGKCPSMPIICGGTGLYLKACLYDYRFEEETEESPADEAYEQMDTAALYAMLLQMDPAQSEKIHPNNRRRIIRSLTIQKRTGRRQSEIVAEQQHAMIYDAFIAGCTQPREQLYDRINARVEQMFRAGLQAEVEGLLAQGITFASPCMRGIGYQEWAPYFAHACTAEEVKEEIQRHSRQYAKRQYTWLNHQMPVHWFEPDQPADRDRMKEEILRWKSQSLSG